MFKVGFGLSSRFYNVLDNIFSNLLRFGTMQMSWDESNFAWNDADETVFPYLRIVQSGSRSFNDFDSTYDDATKANIL